MKTAKQTLDEIKQARKAHGLPPCELHADYVALIAARLRREGIPYSEAHYSAGRCLTCGEEIYTCPGVHTFEEIQEAARRDEAACGAKPRAHTWIDCGEGTLTDPVTGRALTTGVVELEGFGRIFEVYDYSDTPEQNMRLILAAPAMRAALVRLCNAALARASTMGDPSRLIETTDELNQARIAATEVLNRIR